MKRYWLAVLIVLMALAALPAQEKVEIADIQGKVEVKGKSGDWMPAQKGQPLSSDMWISTGFGAKAVLNLIASTIEVQPLTRMTVGELAKQGDSIKTTVNLKVGRIKAKVQTTEGVTHDFKVLSSTSTAAVRGTEFDYDGYVLKVTNGVVDFQMSSGKLEIVFAGEVNGGEQTLKEAFTVSPSTVPAAYSALTGQTTAQVASYAGSLVVEVR